MTALLEARNASEDLISKILDASGPAGLVEIISERVKLEMCPRAKATARGRCLLCQGCLIVIAYMPWFTCLNCEFHGDALTWVMTIERKSRSDAAEQIAERCGVPFTRGVVLDIQPSEPTDAASFQPEGVRR